MGESETYNVNYYCNNCYYSGPVQFQKGESAPKGDILCPRCGCHECVKQERQPSVISEKWLGWLLSSPRFDLSTVKAETTPMAPNSPAPIHSREDISKLGKPETYYKSLSDIDGSLR